MNAAAYARYSTEHQTSSSIAYQMRKIEEYCKSHDITITARYTEMKIACLIQRAETEHWKKHIK